MILVPENNVMENSVLLEDTEMKMGILRDHLLVGEGAIPPKVLEKFPLDMEIKKNNMAGKEITFIKTLLEDGQGDGIGQ